MPLPDIDVTRADPCAPRATEQHADTLLRQTLENLPHAILVHDADGRIVFANDRALAVIGKRRTDLLGRGGEALPSAITDVYRSALARAIESKRHQRAELVVQIGGSEHTATVDFVPILDGDGRLTQTLSVAVDVTARKRAEEALTFLAEANDALASSLDYATILANVARIAVPFLADWCVVDLTDGERSPMMALRHVRPEKEALAHELRRRFSTEAGRSRGWWEMVHGGRSQLIADADELLARMAHGDQDSLELLRRIGVKSWILVPLVARGRTLGVVSLAITESGRRYGPDDLALAEMFVRRAAVTIDNAHLYLLAQEQMQALERAAVRASRLQTITAALSTALTPACVAEVVAREAAGTLGAAATAVALADDDALELVQSTGARVNLFVAGQRLPLGEATPTTDAYGSATPVLLRSRDEIVARYPSLPVPHDGGVGALAAIPMVVDPSVLGVVIFAFDTAREFPQEDTTFMRAVADQAGQALERARLYEAEQQARAAAQEASAAKDQFLAMVSHELRNPLTALQTGVEVLRRQGPADNRTTRVLEIIERNAKLQARLVNDLLDLSRLTRGRLQLQRAPLALDAVVRSACQTYEAEAEEARLTLTTDIATDLWVHGDFDRLHQVVLNLLSNALKFTPAGGHITVSVGRSPADPGRARIAVADTGMGIDRGLLAHLFDMFHQGEVGAQRRPGLGIGLALVKGITERHGGRVWAESRGAGKGSRFILELPLVAAPSEMAPGPRSTTEPAPLQVLVIEDSPDTRVLIADSLVLMGYGVQTAASGEEALEVLADTRPDVILADIGLPGMSGYQFLERARRLPQMHSVLAFAVTGYGQEDDVRRGREAGFSGHFVKPVDMSALDRRIREFLQASR